MSLVTYDDIVANEELKTYILKADEALKAIGYTEHAFAHMGRTAADACNLLLELGCDARTAELARIAGYMHDSGNVVNRVGHAQSGALMAFRILDKMGMPAEEVATVVSAIGHHDESAAFPVNAVAAALILADKSDVRRSRVRSFDTSALDIHDRVNYAVERSELKLDAQNGNITLSLAIDTDICAVMDYFEIFLNRMLLCRRAAEFLSLHFRLNINGAMLL